MDVEGIYITAEDGRWLIERLRRAGRADQIWLAARLEDALAYDVDLEGLDDRERDAMIDALTSEIPPRLEQLRTVLEVD